MNAPQNVRLKKIEDCVTSHAQPQRATLPTGPLQRACRATLALMLREMSTRYGRSPGGYVWAVLEPIGAVIVISVALQFLIRVPPLGSSFLLFYASGYLVFYLYNTLQQHISLALTFSKPLLMYPAVSWIDAVLARFFLNTLTGLGVVAVCMTGIVWWTQTNVTFDMPMILASLFLMALLGLGHGTLNCVLTGLFPVWGHIWGILSRPLLVVAGVFFIVEDLPQNAQDVLWWTPWIHATTLFRQGVYPTYQPEFVSVTLVLLWALIPLFFGLLLLRRHRQDILMQ